MAISRLDYPFSVGSRQYIFDGATLSLYENKGDAQSINTSPDGSSFDSARGTYLRSLALNLTNNCNLNCGYCYAGQGCYDNPGVVMRLETACRSVDLVIDSVVRHDGNSATIGFFGGEPLLAFDLIEKIVDYVNARAPKSVVVHYLVTTNGTRLNSEHVSMMKQNRFRVMLSIDGDSKMHNSYRVYPDGSGSYVDVVKAIEMLIDNVPLQARITIADENTAVDKAVKHILMLGIRRITYALDYKLSDQGFAQFMVSLKQMVADFRTAIMQGEYFDITNITEPVSAVVLRKKKRSHCNAGVSYLSVSAEGNLYRCPRFTGNKCFSLGSVEQASEGKVDKAVEQFGASLKQGAESRTSECTDCPFKYLCGGICYHHAFSITGNEFATIPRECNYRRSLFSLVLELLCSLTVSERRGFLLSLNQFWQEERG